jgi:hypothetical protein
MSEASDHRRHLEELPCSIQPPLSMQRTCTESDANVCERDGGNGRRRLEMGMPSCQGRGAGFIICVHTDVERHSADKLEQHRQDRRGACKHELVCQQVRAPRRSVQARVGVPTSASMSWFVCERQSVCRQHTRPRHLGEPERGPSPQTPNPKLETPNPKP